MREKWGEEEGEWKQRKTFCFDFNRGKKSTCHPLKENVVEKFASGKKEECLSAYALGVVRKYVHTIKIPSPSPGKSQPPPGRRGAYANSSNNISTDFLIGNCEPCETLITSLIDVILLQQFVCNCDINLTTKVALSDKIKFIFAQNGYLNTIATLISDKMTF